MLVDCLVVKPRQAGLRSYALSLVESLAAMPDVEITVLASEDTRDDWAESVPVTVAGLRKNSAIERAVWRRLFLRKIVRSTGADVVLTVSPEWADAGVPTVIVVHDLGPALAPGLYGRTRALRYSLTLDRTVRKATAVVTVSAATKLDLVRWVGPEVNDKVHVVRNAAQSLPDPADSRDILPPGPYALYVGAYLKHKNVETILGLFARGESDVPRYLVCVGPDYGGEKLAVLGPHADAEWLVSPGFVAPADLSALYQSAHVVLYPSLFEGFGLPILEALQHGSPVIATRLSVFEEIAGQLPEYVDDPLSLDAWADALRHVQDRDTSETGVQHLPTRRGWGDVANEMAAVVRGLTDAQPESEGSK